MPVLRKIMSLGLLLSCAGAIASDVEPFALRNQHPVLHVYGLPVFQTAALQEHGRSTLRVSLDMANHAERAENLAESLVLDGESYFLNLSWRRGVKDWLELGLDIPLVSHSRGSFDSAIKNWHDIWGLSNSKREGPSDQLQFLYTVDELPQLEMYDPVSGIGDIQLSAAVPLGKKSDAGRHPLALRFGVKLPTGDADKLLGSGGVDGSVGLYTDRTTTLFGRPTGISGFAGVIGLGSGDLLPDRQRDFVPYGGLAVTWHASDRFGITGQFQAQGAYVDSDLDELGGSSIQLAIGGAYRFRGDGWVLRFALVEDLISDTTPDFGLYVGIGTTSGR